MRKLSLCVAASALALGACTEVPTGHRGVETRFGVVEEVHDEGLVWHFITDVNLMDMRQLKVAEQTEAYTKDVQQANVKYAMTYRLDPSATKTVYTTVGVDWYEKLVPQVVEQAIKDVFGQSEAVKDAINNRSGVQQRILSELKVQLRKRNVIVEGFELKDISFSKNFEAAVEAKQVAVENANAARNKTVEIEERAKQKVIAAKAEAEAMRIKTQALAGSPKLVEYEAVQKWDGVLPKNMYGGTMPFIKVN
jgi:regulator of protease activity HflC (stomatin/prohibitin superfamily)